MWVVVVGVMLPCLQLLARVLHRDELFDVENFIPQLAVERLDELIVRGLCRPRVVELQATSLGPFIQGP